MTLRNPYISTRSAVTLGHGTNVWTDENGGIHGTARLGDAQITFHSPVQVREVIAYLVLLADEMDAEGARADAARAEAGDGDPDDDPPPPCPECGSRQPAHYATCSWRRVSDTLNARAGGAA